MLFFCFFFLFFFFLLFVVTSSPGASSYMVSLSDAIAVSRRQSARIARKRKQPSDEDHEPRRKRARIARMYLSPPDADTSSPGASSNMDMHSVGNDEPRRGSARPSDMRVSAPDVNVEEMKLQKKIEKLKRLLCVEINQHHWPGAIQKTLYGPPELDGDHTYGSFIQEGRRSSHRFRVM